MLLRQGSVRHCQVEHPADQLRLGEHPLGLHPAGPDRRPHLLSLHHLWNSGANDGRSIVNCFHFKKLTPTYYLRSGQNATDENPEGWVKVPAGTPNSENHVGYTEDVHALDLPIPLSSLLEFFFYFGWLHVSQVLINPLGDDDEDFDVNDLLDRHLQVILVVIIDY